jgi:ferredoxin-like protein FixX
MGVNNTLDWKEKTDKNNVFTCGTCRKVIKHTKQNVVWKFIRIAGMLILDAG